MDFSKIPISVKKAWLYDTYIAGIITKKEYEKDLKELEATDYITAV